MEPEKNKVGQPPKYKTVEELQKKVDEYFELVKGKKSTEWLYRREVTGAAEDQKEVEPTEWEREPQRAKITSLCLFLGFESRQSFYDYGKRDEFSYAIKKAHLRIEESYEDMLHDSKNPAGPIFALKNLQWKDRTETDLNVKTERNPLEDLTKGNEL